MGSELCSCAICPFFGTEVRRNDPLIGHIKNTGPKLFTELGCFQILGSLIERLYRCINTPDSYKHTWQLLHTHLVVRTSSLIHPGFGELSSHLAGLKFRGSLGVVGDRLGEVTVTTMAAENYRYCLSILLLSHTPWRLKGDGTCISILSLSSYFLSILAAFDPCLLTSPIADSTQKGPARKSRLALSQILTEIRKQDDKLNYYD